MSTQTVASAMRSNTRRALGIVALVLSLIVYCAGLLYAGVRSYSLFAATISADMLPLAVLGIIALELSALALPLALHYWTAPGIQRYIASGFYLADMGLIVANAILDAAHHSGTVLPEFLVAYGTYAVPALPVLCMMGWALIWTLDPASREADMRASVVSATQEALFNQMIRAAEGVDITAAVQAAAEASARSLVAETLGRSPASAPQTRQEAASAPQAQIQPPAASEPGSLLEMPTGTAQPIQAAIPELAEPIVTRRNGHSKPPAADPKA